MLSSGAVSLAASRFPPLLCYRTAVLVLRGGGMCHTSLPVTGDGSRHLCYVGLVLFCVGPLHA